MLESLESRVLLSAGIGGMIWQDANADGIRQSGEAGVAGAVAELFSVGPDGVFGSPVRKHGPGARASGLSAPMGHGDDLSLGVAITDATGLYTFWAVPAGTYYVQFRAPSGYTAYSPQDQIGDEPSGLP